MNKSLSLEISRIDELRFGMKTAKAVVNSAEQVRQVLSACQAQCVRLAILRVPVDAQAAVMASERAGALLMDTLCHYEHLLRAWPAATQMRPSPVQAAEAPSISFRLAGPDDGLVVESIAREAFRDYRGHYQADPRLRTEDSAEVYPSWARSCAEQASDTQPVVIAATDEQAVGFAALRRSSPAELDVALLGIGASARGRGVASALLNHLLASCAGWGAARLTYSTQINNVPMQRLLATAGFLPTHSFYTFHHWNSEASS